MKKFNDTSTFVIAIGVLVVLIAIALGLGLGLPYLDKQNNVNNIAAAFDNNTIVNFNQLTDPVKVSSSSSGISNSFNNNSGVFSMSGTTTGSNVTLFYWSSFSYLTSGHKFLLWTDSTLDIRFISWTSGNQNAQFIYKNSITTLNSTGGQCIIRLYSTSGSVINNSFHIMLLDLSNIYGCGNEPTTVAQFKQDFPCDYYSYTLGTSISLDGLTNYQNGLNVGKSQIDSQMQDTINSLENTIDSINANINLIKFSDFNINYVEYMSDGYSLNRVEGSVGSSPYFYSDDCESFTWNGLYGYKIVGSGSNNYVGFCFNSNDFPSLTVQDFQVKINGLRCLDSSGNVLSNGIQVSKDYVYNSLSSYIDYSGNSIIFTVNAATLPDVIVSSVACNSIFFESMEFFIADGVSLDTVINNSYNSGFEDGKNVGSSNSYNKGYNDGYLKGLNNQNSFISVATAPIDATLSIFDGLFNWELFGVNLKGFILSLFSLLIVITIFKLVLGR